MLQSMAAPLCITRRFSSGQVSEAVPFPEITVYPLRDSDNQQRHGVIMSRRDIAGFDRSKTQLIYTSARTGERPPSCRHRTLNPDSLRKVNGKL